MKREIWWQSIDAVGLEHLRFESTDRGAVAEGTVFGGTLDDPFDLRYRVECDALWRVRSARVSLASAPGGELSFDGDGDGRWTDGRGAAFPEFDGCFEIDISATPFTNTLPIRRIDLAIGASAEISVIYLLIPEMTARRSRQLYTRLGNKSYRFEEKGVFNGFTAEISIDEDGFVVDYPQLFKKIGGR